MTNTALTPRQQALIPIAAFAAAGDIPQLNTALAQGLDNGVSISDAKEVLVQVYAYAGFPRSLNALGALMKLVSERKEQGIEDDPGQESPSKTIPQGKELLAAGTRNQTSLAGAPVQGPLFDFAPAIDTYLKAHLFGDIFERDNLDWKDRELATVSMLSALTGAESQVGSHVNISMNAGVTADQLRQLVEVLNKKVDTAAAKRAGDALEQALA
ncbi:carboxymuconolactone decarboxylase family protein [Marinobacterium mangrovicola]|uniref:Carboxymuconolactone decarboxylase family protein n=1 Tax=Marinobacterium mangrovicola TaxID=1476959 RepID=A0A4R1GBU8_9GAMM|nr:carboxymuconolactone decarboxylase family protein [Marinobacterium mangrovicola]TCK04201.1 carboxymuconolactone decarboxylase family protein [Marinobacterium mangrovicola]